MIFEDNIDMDPHKVPLELLGLKLFKIDIYDRRSNEIIHCTDNHSIRHLHGLLGQPCMLEFTSPRWWASHIKHIINYAKDHMNDSYLMWVLKRLSTSDGNLSVWAYNTVFGCGHLRAEYITTETRLIYSYKIPSDIYQVIKQTMIECKNRCKI